MHLNPGIELILLFLRLLVMFSLQNRQLESIKKVLSDTNTRSCTMNKTLTSPVGHIDGICFITV